MSFFSSCWQKLKSAKNAIAKSYFWKGVKATAKKFSEWGKKGCGWLLGKFVQGCCYCLCGLLVGVVLLSYWGVSRLIAKCLPDCLMFDLFRCMLTATTHTKLWIAFGLALAGVSGLGEWIGQKIGNGIGWLGCGLVGAVVGGVGGLLTDCCCATCELICPCCFDNSGYVEQIDEPSSVSANNGPPQQYIADENGIVSITETQIEGETQPQTMIFSPQMLGKLVLDSNIKLSTDAKPTAPYHGL